MTEVTPYQDQPRAQELLVPATDSWVASVAEVVKLAGYIAGTTFVPEALRGSAPATAATILYGREIGVGPMTALQMIHPIKGRVGMAAELMRARVLAQGHELEVVESTTNLCRIRGRRAGSDTWTTVTWTMADARTAGLSGDGWRKYPRPMLLARASAELCRMVFPDVTHGMVATEELGDTEPPLATERPTPARRVGRAKRAEPEQAPSWAEPEVPQAQERAEPPSPPPPPDPSPSVPVSASSPDTEGEAGPEQDTPEAAAAERGDGPATDRQTRHVMALLRDLGVGQTREDRLHLTQAVVQRRVTSFAQLTVTDASRLITTLVLARDSQDPGGYVDWLVAEGHTMLAAAEQGEPPTEEPPEEGEQ